MSKEEKFKEVEKVLGNFIKEVDRDYRKNMEFLNEVDHVFQKNFWSLLDTDEKEEEEK